MKIETAMKLIEILTEKVESAEAISEYRSEKNIEQLKKIENLEAKNAELEARIAELEELLDRAEKCGILKMEEVNDD